MIEKMTSMERVLTTMSHREPDRVPQFLMCTHYGSKLLEMPTETYFGRSENVAKGQLEFLRRFRNDGLNAYYSAAHEFEAFGGEVHYLSEGPPNAGEPIIKHPEDILKMDVPNIINSRGLKNCLETISILRKTVGLSVPICGGVLSAFTLPIMQLGFSKYIELIYERPELLIKLMQINEQFSIEWANMQLKAGATFVSLGDTMAVSSIVPKDLYLKYAFPSAKRIISQIKGEVALATSSESVATILEEVLASGYKAILASHNDNISELKLRIGKRATIIGNLNGIEMCHWSDTDVETAVKSVLKQAGTGGGLVISDSMGDIPYQVEEKVLEGISASVHQWGTYPLKWE